MVFRTGQVEVRDACVLGRWDTQISELYELSLPSSRQNSSSDRSIPAICQLSLFDVTAFYYPYFRIFFLHFAILQAVQCFKLKFLNHVPRFNSDLNSQYYKPAEHFLLAPLAKLKLKGLQLRANGSRNSTNLPYHWKQERPASLGHLGPVVKRWTSMLVCFHPLRGCLLTALRTSSKATTVWPLATLCNHVPKPLHQGLRSSRYYVLSSDSITIQCDSHRSQTDNTTETHRRLADEITRIYKDTIPGVTSPEKKKRLEEL